MKQTSLCLLCAFGVIAADAFSQAIDVTSTGTTVTNQLLIDKARVTSSGSAATTLGLGSLDSSGGTVQYGVKIKNMVEGSSSSGSVPQGIAIFTGTNSSPTERLRITNAGNIGIGTSDPHRRLQIDSTGGNDSIFLTGNAPGLAFSDTVNGSERATVGMSTFPGAFMSSAVMGDLVLRTTGGSDILFGTGSGSSEVMRVTNGGLVGIGTSSPSYKLQVAGSVRATSFIANVNTYSDFVFRPGYRLPRLSEVDLAIRRDGHLPDIPSEAEARQSGLDLATMQAKLLQKVEELTLYAIEQDKRLKMLEEENRRLSSLKEPAN